jgi:hypothetical protein
MDRKVSAETVAYQTSKTALQSAANARDAAERKMISAIGMARELGMSWRDIAECIDRSYANVRQRYSKLLGETAGADD